MLIFLKGLSYGKFFLKRELSPETMGVAVHIVCYDGQQLGYEVKILIRKIILTSENMLNEVYLSYN